MVVDTSRLELTIAATTHVLGSGCAAVVPPNPAHSARALTDARAIVIDHPARHSIGGVDLR